MVSWEKRARRSQELQYTVQAGVGQIEGQSVFAFLLPALPGSTGGLPVQMVVRSANDFKALYELMEQLKAKARESGLFVVVDSDLAFNTPSIRLSVDHAKANELGISMQAVADTLAVLVGNNYINRFNLQGRSYDVIPQTPRANRLTPESLGQYYVKSTSASCCRSRTLCKSKTVSKRTN